jgi:hypothetical protein
MADVYAITFSLIGILISFPALLVIMNLLLPGVTERVQTRLVQTPGKSFVMGISVTAALLLWIAIASQVNFGPVRGTAFIAAILGMGIGTIGAAGMARLLGERLAPITQPNSKSTNLIRGAIVYELACLFPVVGWFLFFPLIGITLIGAAVFGLLRWLPRPRSVTSTQATANHSA